MEIKFLGTGAGVPSKGRNVSSLVLKLLDELNQIWMFDCGEGTQLQILRTSIKPRKVSKIFITHLHGDHIFGLPGFLSSRSFQGGNDPLTLYGPTGIKEFTRTSLKLSASKLSYPLNIVELNPEGGQLDLEQGWRMDYLPLDHGILSFGYRITEPDYPGELLMDKLAEYQIPSGPIYGQLKAGKQVELPDGRILYGKDFVAPKRPGRIITILGDTRYTNNSIKLAHGADVLVHEATHAGAETQMARQYYHSTNVQAAQVAQQANAKQLYMNHISARYLAKDIQALEAEAQQTFQHAQIVYDLNCFDIPRP